MPEASRDVENLETFIGGRLRARRKASGDRQEDVAARIRELGLGFDRTTVASVEVGRRSLRLSEVLLCCASYRVSLAELLAPEPDEVLAMGDGIYTSVSTLHRIVTGKDVAAAAVDIEGNLGRLPGQRTTTRKSEVVTPPTETERLVARRLATSPATVRVAAEALWGCLLDHERDGRLAARSAGPAAPLRGRRGHVTRELVEELRVHLTKPKRRR